MSNKHQSEKLKKDDPNDKRSGLQFWAEPKPFQGSNQKLNSPKIQDIKSIIFLSKSSSNKINLEALIR